MKLILSIALITLTGCANVSGHHINKANTYCSDKGGVDELTVHLFGEVVITCNTGETRLASQIRL